LCSLHLSLCVPNLFLASACTCQSAACSVNMGFLSV
jgi:hypothetical protein